MLIVFLWCLFVASMLLVLRELLSIGVVVYLNIKYKGRSNVVYVLTLISFISPFLLAFSALSLFYGGM